MASFTISELKPTSLVDSTATIPCSYLGKTYRLEVSNLATYFGSGRYTSIYSGDCVTCTPNPIVSTGTIEFESIGLMSLYAGITDPVGWLICNGRSLPKVSSIYSPLFSVIGDTYSSPVNATTYQIPNMSGVAAFGLDDMGGLPAGRLTADNLNGATPTKLGSKGGSISQTLVAENCPLATHAHQSGSLNFLIGWGNGADSGGGSNTGNPERNFTFNSASYVADQNNYRYADAAINSKTVGAAVQTTTTTSHPHIPPLILLNWIIKI